MPPGPGEPKTEQIQARVPRSLRQTIDEMAVDEGRSLSQMTQRLLEEAIAARKRKR